MNIGIKGIWKICLKIDMGGFFFIVEREVKNKKAEDRGWGTWKSLGSDLLLPLIHKNTALMHWIYLWRIRLNTAFQCLEAYIISGIFFHIFLKDALIWNIKWFRNSILFMSSVIFSILLLKKLRVNGGSSSSFFFFFNQKCTSLSRVLSCYESEKKFLQHEVWGTCWIRKDSKLSSWNRLYQSTLLYFIGVIHQ